jgi:hypothetical protein
MTQMIREVWTIPFMSSERLMQRAGTGQLLLLRSLSGKITWCRDPD